MTESQPIDYLADLVPEAQEFALTTMRLRHPYLFVLPDVEASELAGRYKELLWELENKDFNAAILAVDRIEQRCIK